MAKILVLGAYGLVGASLCERLRVAGYEVLRQGRRENAEVQLDPTNRRQLSAAISKHAPSRILNLVAATDVERCEAEPQYAWELNVRIVELLAEILGSRRQRQPLWIHISTDQVYDGPGPHREINARPPNVYAVTKYAGEREALRAGAMVLRTNIIGRSRTSERPSLSDWLVSSIRAGKSVPVFDDVRFSPLHLDTLGDVIAKILPKTRPGIFNLGSRGGQSKAWFAKTLVQALGLNDSLLRVSTSASAQFRARRPKDMRMNCVAFETEFRLRLPTSKSQVLRTAEDYLHENT